MTKLKPMQQPGKYLQSVVNGILAFFTCQLNSLNYVLQHDKI